MRVIHQEDIILNYPIKRALKYMTQKWTEQKEELGKSTIILGDFNIALSAKSSSCSSYEIRQEITKGIEELNTSTKLT